MLAYFAVTAVTGVVSGFSEWVVRTFQRDRIQQAEKTGQQVTKHARWTPFDFIAIAILVTFSAMRFEVGTDYLAYYRRYYFTDPGSWSEFIAASPQEAGFTTLSLFLKTISDSPYLIFWVTSALTVIPAYVAIKKKSYDPTMSVLLYILLAFFVSPFNIIRQGVAISLNFWASTFIDKNKKAFVLINAIATMFHTSVVIAAIVQLVIHKWKPTGKKVFLFVIVGLAGAGLLKVAPVAATWLNALNPRYDNYLAQSAENTAGLGTYLVIAAHLALLIYAIVMLKNQPPKSELENQDNSRYMVYVAAGLAFVIIGTQSIVVSRLEYYFAISLVLLIPNAIRQAKSADLHRLIMLVMAGIYFAFFLTHYGDLVPYKTIDEATIG